MVATHVEIQTNLEQTESIIKTRKETIAEKKIQIQKQNSKFRAHSANWGNFLVQPKAASLFFCSATHLCCTTDISGGLCGRKAADARRNATVQSGVLSRQE